MKGFISFAIDTMVLLIFCFIASILTENNINLVIFIGLIPPLFNMLIFSGKRHNQYLSFGEYITSQTSENMIISGFNIDIRLKHSYTLRFRFYWSISYSIFSLILSAHIVYSLWIPFLLLLSFLMLYTLISNQSGYKITVIMLRHFFKNILLLKNDKDVL